MYRCGAKIQKKNLNFPPCGTIFPDCDWRPNSFTHVLNSLNLEFVVMLNASAESNGRTEIAESVHSGSLVTDIIRFFGYPGSGIQCNAVAKYNQSK